MLLKCGFFAPLKKEDRQKFELYLLNRLSSGVFTHNTEAAVTYIDRVLDRQINKANGLLAFNVIHRIQYY